jgi:hypothetical protein
MPDLSAPVGALLEIVGPLVGRALRTFLATSFGMGLFVLVTAGVGVAIASDAGPYALGAVGAISLVGGVAVSGGWP